MTELCDRVLKAGGPALLFEQPQGRFRGAGGRHDPGARQPVRHAAARRARDGRRGDDWRSALREIGKLLAFLKEPEPPKGLKDAWQNTRPVFMKVLDMAPKERSVGAVPGRRVGRRATSISRACRCRPAGRATPGRSSPGA